MRWRWRKAYIPTEGYIPICRLCKLNNFIIRKNDDPDDKGFIVCIKCD